MVVEKRRVLFVCSRNACRSQMAEGILRHLGGDAYEVVSAGIEATGVHPLAIKAMAEAGIDISHYWSKAVKEFAGQRFDHVITTCDDAVNRCQEFPGRGSRIHWPVRNPAAATGTEEERLHIFREVRRDLKERIENFIVIDTQSRAKL
jgi:arsenate reductase